MSKIVEISGVVAVSCELSDWVNLLFWILLLLISKFKLFILYILVILQLFFNEGPIPLSSLFLMYP